MTKEFRWDDKASRELDAKIHVKDGNEEVNTYSVDSYYSLESSSWELELDYSSVRPDVPHYSTDIAAAMTIKTKYGLYLEQSGKFWLCAKIAGELEGITSASFRDGWVLAETPELAICGAFLNTKNLSEPKGKPLYVAE